MVARACESRTRWLKLVVIAACVLLPALCQRCPRSKLSNYGLKRFGRVTLNRLCDRTESWNSNAKKRSGKSLDQILSAKQLDWFNEVKYCDSECLCKKSKSCNSGRNKRQTGLRRLPPVTRKEYRTLTDAERNRFHRAVNALKNNRIDNLSKYEILVVYHTPENSPGAHFGAAFLPFHRELLKYLEVALRIEDPEVSIPYWDSTLDQALPTPVDSVLWSEQFMGNPRGPVDTGPFAGWNVYDHPRARQQSPNLRLVRNAGGSRFGSLYRPADIQQIRNSIQNYASHSFCINPFFEMVHGAVHIWVGGIMDPLEASPNDPIFFLLHAFVDKLWEDFRQSRQNPFQRQNDYASERQACNSFHFRNAPMRPFNKRNIDGLSNEYTEFFYNYQDRPSCGNNFDRCSSDYLFCHTGMARCLSKVRPGGDCRGLERYDSCAHGRCTNGRCMFFANPTQPPTQPRTRPPRTRPPTRPPTTRRRTFPPRTRPPRTPRPTRPPSTRPPRTRPPRTRPPRTRPPTTPPRRPAPPRRRTTKRPRKTTEAASDGISRDTVWFPVTIQQYHNHFVRNVKDAFIKTTVIGSGDVYFGELAEEDEYPYYVGAAFAQIPNPGRQRRPIRAKLTAQGTNGERCKSLCFRGSDRGYVECDIVMRMGRGRRQDITVAYTPIKEQAPYLSWNGPERKPDKYYFLCPFEDGGLPALEELSTANVLGFGKPIRTATDLAIKGCANKHRCCRLWESVGECKRNPNYLNSACPAACGTCSREEESGCADHSQKCKRWKRNGECKRNPSWMDENCPRSCDVCGRSLDELKLLCGARHKAGCRNFDKRCKKWSRKGECKKNSWWMGQNCPLACKRCKKKHK